MINTMKWRDILTIVNGKNQKKVITPNGSYPIYGSGGIIGRANDYLCEAGTTIIGRKGTIDNPLFINERFWNVDTAFGICPGPLLNPRFLYFFCLSFNFRLLDKSTTIPSLTKNDLLNIEMPVPPLLVQERIVAHLEELFSQLENGVEMLKKTKQQLAVYRQTILVSVISSYDGDIFKLSDIADTIDGDRGKNYPKKNDLSKDGGCLFLTAANVRPYGWSFQNNNFITEEKDKILHGGKLKKNDIVITTRGTLGNIAVYDESVPFKNVRINSCMLIIRTRGDIVSPHYLAQYLISPMFKHKLERLKSGTAQPQIPASILKEIQIRVPCMSIQEKVVTELNNRLSICESIEKTIDAALQQAKALRQSILKNTFEGDLF